MVTTREMARDVKLRPAKITIFPKQLTTQYHYSTQTLFWSCLPSNHILQGEDNFELHRRLQIFNLPFPTFAGTKAGL